MTGLLFLAVWIFLAAYSPELVEPIRIAGEKFIATALADIFTGDSLSRIELDFTGLTVVSVALLAGVLWISICARSRLRVSFIIALIGTLTTLAITAWLALYRGMLFNPTYILLGWLGVYICIAPVKAVDLAMGGKKVRKLFEHRVSDSVLKQLEMNPAALLGMDAMSATVTSSELNGFRKAMEDIPIDKINSLLKRYQGPMARTIMTRKGFVKTCECDRIIAVWGAPCAIDNHAVQACDAVLDQIAILERFQQDFEKEFKMKFAPAYGIAAGNLAAGIMEADGILRYRIVGRPLAAVRWLRYLCRLYGTCTVVDADTYKQANGTFIFRQLDRIAEGRFGPKMEIYELLGRKGEIPSERMQVSNLYAEGLELYLAADFSGALAKLQDALALVPKDGPSRLLIKRVRELKSDPPENWNGVHVWEMK